MGGRLTVSGKELYLPYKHSGVCGETTDQDLTPICTTKNRYFIVTNKKNIVAQCTSLCRAVGDSRLFLASPPPSIALLPYPTMCKV